MQLVNPPILPPLARSPFRFPRFLTCLTRKGASVINTNECHSSPVPCSTSFGQQGSPSFCVALLKAHAETPLLARWLIHSRALHHCSHALLTAHTHTPRRAQWAQIQLCFRNTGTPTDMAEKQRCTKALTPLDQQHSQVRPFDKGEACAGMRCRLVCSGKLQSAHDLLYGHMRVSCANQRAPHNGGLQMEQYTKCI